MGIGSAFGGALAGAGRALSSISNKYIDEELAQERAKMLADLQLKSAKDLDEYQMSEPRQAKLRENASAASLAQKAAERQATVQGVGDAAYQGALDTNAANDTRRRVTSENALIEGTTPTKITAANQIEDGTRGSRMATVREETKIRADGQIRATNATREAGGIGAKLADYEKVLGRTLTEAERLTLMGLKKPDKDNDELLKMAREATQKALEGGSIKPEEAAGYTTKILSGYRAEAQGQALMTRVGEARASGHVGELIGSMRSQGLSEQQLAGLFKPEELKASPAPAAGNNPLPRKAPEPQKSYEQLSAESLAKADDRQLRRLAGIKGHKDQKAAAEELARRQKLWDEAAAEQQTTGFGFN